MKRNMNKKAKKILVIGGGIVLAFVAVWGGMVLLRNAQKQAVKVYAVTDFAMTDYWGDSSETSGMVTTDKLQKIMISDTQKVSEIFVQEGQTVKEGDPLLSFDTTLSTLEVKKAEIELQRLKLQLTMAEKELKDLNAMKPYSSTLITPSNNIEYLVQTPPFLIRGNGTAEDPYYYLWSMEEMIDEEMFSVLFGDKNSEEEEETAEQECYVVLLIRDQNALNGEVLESYGLYLKKTGEKISMQLYQPELPEDILKYDAEEEPYYQESGSEYTAAELKELRGEKAQEIADLKVSIKIAELEYQKMQSETEDGMVKSTITGTVKAVRDPNEAYKNGEAVVEVSGGGGYYIEGAMSELELDAVKVGQTVQINSWMTGSSCEGEIIEILSYPTTNSNSWSDGNRNVSYYPFRVFVEEEAQLQENDYVSITYQNQNQNQSEDCLYLENMFIWTENGKSYVYVKNEKGTLEKRDVQTGRDLYGSYTQILGGITAEDFVAFPYGKDVFDGAKTKDATMDEFYNY